MKTATLTKEQQELADLQAQKDQEARDLICIDLGIPIGANQEMIDFIVKSREESQAEIEKKYGNSIIKGRGRSAQTWVHPLIFIDIALAINPKLKLEVYEWIFDHLIKFRNDSGDSYKEMSAALFTRFGNVREFQKYIASVADEIRDALNVSDWQTATEQQLEKRDKIHRSIKLLCRVLTDTKQIVRLAITENAL